MKAIYFVFSLETFGGHWHRSTKLEDCLKNLKNPKKYRLCIFICKRETPKEVLENLSKCFSVTQYGSIEFYQPVVSTEEYRNDLKQKDEYVIGWVEEYVDLEVKK